MVKPQIMVVEDEWIVAQNIQKHLQKLGYAVPHIVGSGEEAVRLAEKSNPDVVLMDIVLLGKTDGIETANQIRSRFDIPVIYLTAYADNKMLERAKLTEPFGYVIKPFGDREIQVAIEMAMYKHKMEKQLKESKNWLSTTLRSIGDAVIATDVRTCVNFMNPVAESLMGWQESEVCGKPLKDYFRIMFNGLESQGYDLLKKAMVDGVVVNHMNHQLIAKDGRKIAIDLSVAPIKNDNNRINGVVVVFRDITERKQAEAAFQKQREDFISILIHDLKGGVVPILGFTERLIKGKVKTEQDLQDTFQIIKKAAQDLLQNIEKTSQSLKRKARLQCFNPEKAPLTNIVINVINNIMSIIDEKGIEILFNDRRQTHWHQLDEIFLTVDSYQFQTLVENMLGNAVKYARNSIKVYLKGSDNCIKFVISDDGPGIPKIYHKQIFKEYFQVPGSKEGTGIGLYSVQKVVENHRGKIVVYSAEDMGTTFEITFPLLKF
ncbi:MAG TPA: ATP-binding protein [Thermodesulfovibrionia bacterium]|nr:ATP-binding protein [Thermodesulfovibrionia bacterium]